MLVALSVIVLGAIMLRRPRVAGWRRARAVRRWSGLIHGYALGESIYGAEPTPLAAYLIGLAVIQSAIALAAMTVARVVRSAPRPWSTLRLVGAGIAGIGLAVLMQQIIPGA